MSARSILACWDNSTRGLDASSALEFAQALRLTTNIARDAAVVAIYQAGERVYEGHSTLGMALILVFDKVTVLYEGRQIYFGRVENAKQYFLDQGWQCMDRQTTADFLTAVTGFLFKEQAEIQIPLPVSLDPGSRTVFQRHQMSSLNSGENRPNAHS